MTSVLTDPAAPAQTERDATVRLLACVLLMAAVAVTAWRSLLAAATLAWNNPEYSHILLVLPISAAFLFLEWRERPARFKTSWTGLLPLFTAILLAWWCRQPVVADSVRLSCAMLAVALAWLSLLLLILGADFFRAFAFPLLLLFLLVPWLDSMIAAVVHFLQWGSEKTAYWMFRLARIPVTESGFVLSLPHFDVEVARECSGIRSSMMMLLVSLVLGQLFLRETWKKIVLLLCVVPIAIAKNGLRIFVLSTLGEYAGERWLEGDFHHRGGVVFFVIGMIAVIAAIWLLRGLGSSSSPDVSARPSVVNP